MLEKTFEALNAGDTATAYQYMNDYIVDINMSSQACAIEVKTGFASVLTQTVEYCNTCNLPEKAQSDYEAK